MNFIATIHRIWKIRLALSVGLSAGLGLLACGDGLALSPVNTVNNGQVVAGGPYYNTAQGKTTFINTGRGGLWVKGGTSVRGLEVDDAGELTNNGGTLHFFAPNSAVRIDGNVDVSGVLNGSGAYLGNGGRVFVDSAYLYQNGSIFANGINGGLVQMNVAGMTLGPTARIHAQGFGGTGGIVSVNSNGVVDLQRGSRIDVSGHTHPDMDRNVINIEGSVVNVEGVLRADGVQAAGVGSRGGLIRLVASGRTDISDVQEALQDSDGLEDPTFTTGERTDILTRQQSLADNKNGDVDIAARSLDTSGNPTGGWLSVNGSSGAVADNNDRTEDDTARAGDGGTIILAAEHRIRQAGLASVNGGNGTNGPVGVAGGNGGLIALASRGDIVIDPPDENGNPGVFQANGGRGGQIRLTEGEVPDTLGARGGRGGLIAFSYNSEMINQGGIVAQGGTGAHGAVVGEGNVAAGRAGNGGRGGLIVFSGSDNPTGGGRIVADGGRGGAGLLDNGDGGESGVIVSPLPSTLATTQIVSQHHGGDVSAPLGEEEPLTEQTARDEVLTHAENLLLFRRTDSDFLRPVTLFGSADGDVGSLFSTGSKIRSVGDPLGTGNAATLILSKSPSGPYPYRNYILGSSADDVAVYFNAPATGEWQGIQNLGTLTLVNDSVVLLTLTSDPVELNAYGGSHASILGQYIVSGSGGGGFNLGGWLAGGTSHLGASVIALQSPIHTSVRTGIGVVGFHGGASTAKGDVELLNFADIGIFSGTPLIGMTHRYQTGGTFLNGYRIRSDAGYGSLETPSQGGIITVKAGIRISHIADFFPDGGQITANGISLQGYGGLVKLESAGLDFTGEETIQANGTVLNGTIITRGERP